MPETLKSLQVRPEAVEQTYSPRHQNLEEWRMIMRHARQDKNSVGALAAELGIKKTEIKPVTINFMVN